MHLIAANHLSQEKIKKFAQGRRGFIVFSSGNKTDAFCENLESHGFERIDLREILLSCRTELRQAVINFTGALNSDAPHPNWWANNLSRRIAMHSLPACLAKLFLLRRAIDRKNRDSIVIVDSAYLPWSFLKDGNHDPAVNFSDKCNKNWRNVLQERIPVRAVLWSVRKIFHRLALIFAGIIDSRKSNVLCRHSSLSGIPLKKDSRQAGVTESEEITYAFPNSQAEDSRQKNTITLLTLIDRNCFPSGSAFRDIYLGRLASSLREKGYTVNILARLLGTMSKEVFKGLRNNKDSRLMNIDSYWTFRELYNVTKNTVKEFFGPPPEWKHHIFTGFDIRPLLSALWRIEIGEPAYADALLDGYAYKRYLKRVPTNTLIYPYENKTYERVILQSGNSSGAEIYTTGYQHAVLTPKHIHMFMSEGEADIMPLPDRIVTNGPWTAKMLKERGNYPEGKIVAGTALRFISQEKKSVVRRKPPRKISNVLVALAEGAEEYDRAFYFLRELQKNSPSLNCSFRVRLHPSIPYDPFKKHGCGRNCIRDNEPSLECSLQKADLLLYASTSVAVNAMSLGIPVVWMDLLDFWGTDPIEGDDMLRWKLTDPGEWETAVKNIISLTEQEFQNRLDKSADFAKNYFCQDPVDVSVFLGSR